MAITILQLGSPRHRGESLRLGTVRWPPRGVPKAEFASRNFYDVWLPLLSPSPALLKSATHAKDERAWAAFKKKFRAEMQSPEAARMLDFLSALSQQTNLALGCYCKDEAHCHRSVLRELLAERGASLRQHSDAHSLKTR